MNNDNQSKSSRLRDRVQVPRIEFHQHTQQLLSETDAMISSQGELSSPNKGKQNFTIKFQEEQSKTKENQVGQINQDQVQQQPKVKIEDGDFTKKQSLITENDEKEKGILNLQQDDFSLQKQKVNLRPGESNFSDGSSSVFLDQNQNDKNTNFSQKVQITNKLIQNEQSSMGKTPKNGDETPQKRFINYGRPHFRNTSIQLAENGLKREEQSSGQPQDMNWNTQSNIDIEGFSPTITMFGANMHRSKRSFMALNVNESSTPLNNNSKIKVFPILQSGVSSENIKRHNRMNRISLTTMGGEKTNGVGGQNNSTVGNVSPYINLYDMNRDRQFSKGDQVPGFIVPEGYQSSQYLQAGGALGSQGFIALQGRQGETDSQIQYNQNNSSQIVLSQNLQQQNQQIGHSQFYSAANASQQPINKYPHQPNESNMNWNIAIKIKNISRFLSKLRSQTSDFNKRMLKDFHHKLINDASDSKIYSSSSSSSANKGNNGKKSPLQQSTTLIREDSEEQNCIERVFYSIIESVVKKCFCWNDSQSLSDRISVFSPEQTMIVCWNIIFGLLLLLQFFYIPFVVGFVADPIELTSYRLLFYLVPIIACVIDSLINLNSGYYQQGLVEIDRKKIFRRFVNKFLARDVISLFSLIATYQSNIGYFSLLFFIRIPQLLKIMEETAEYFQLEQKYYNHYQLGRLLFMMLYISHLCCCIFHYISYQIGIQSEQELKTTWLYDAGVFHSTVYTRYVNSFYFIVITMTTVGYGDIKPMAVQEKIYVTVITILGSGIFAYTVNTIGTIFQEIERKKAQSKQRKYELTSYLNQRQVKKDIQIRVLKHLEFSQQREDDDPIRGMNILESVSKNLKEEVCKDFYGRIMQSNKIFNLQFSQQALLDASLHFKEKIFSPGEIIFKEGQVNDHDIYFLYKGSIDLFVQKSKKQSRTIFTAKSGMFFGQGAFFSSAPRECSAKTITVCHLLVLSQSDFIKVLKNHQDDYEKYCVIKDEMNVYKIQQHMTCFSCGQFNHTLLNCHLIHYKRNRDLFLARHRYSIPQERTTKLRKQYGKSSSWMNRQSVRQQLFSFRLDALNLLLQNPSEITDKQFFNGVNKIKFENGFFVIDYEDDEDQQKVKKEGVEGEEEDEDRSFTSEDEENNFRDNQNQSENQNSLSFASIVSVKTNSNLQNNSQDEEFARGGPYYFQSSEAGDDVVEDALLNSIKEVNEIDDDNSEIDKNVLKFQKRKISQNVHKSSVQSHNSKRNIAFSIDDNNKQQQLTLQRQYTHKESNASSAKKIESQRSLQLVNQSSKKIEIIPQDSNSLNIQKFTPRNTSSIDSNNNNTKKEKTNQPSPIFLQKESPQPFSKQEQHQQTNQISEFSKKGNLTKYNNKQLIDILKNDQLDSSSDTSSLSDISQDQIATENSQHNQKVVKVAQVSQFGQTSQQNRKQSQQVQLQLSQKRSRFESVEINSLAHIEQGTPVLQSQQCDESEDHTDLNSLQDKDQTQLLKQQKNDQEQSNDGIKSPLGNKLIVNSNTNKKYVFENIMMSQKKGSILNPSKNKDKELGDIFNIDTIQSDQARKLSQTNDSTDSIIRSDSIQKVKIDSLQPQISSQCSTRQSAPHENKQGVEQEKKKLLIINMNEIKNHDSNDENSKGQTEKAKKPVQLQKRRSKSVTRIKPLQKLTFDKTQRRSSVFDEKYDFLLDSHPEELPPQLSNKSQQKYSVITPTGATTTKSKRIAHQEGVELKTNQEVTFRKISNMSNSKGQGLSSQQDKNVQLQKNLVSSKKVNMPLLNPNEQFLMKQKKKNQSDAIQLLTQYQQLAKQENEKLIEQIKNLLNKNTVSAGATPNAKKLASINSIQGYEQMQTQKFIEDNNNQGRISLHNIQNPDEFPQGVSDFEINDRMIYKMKSNLNYSTDMFYYDFDTLKIFKYYFPLNNYLNVVARYKPKRLRNNNRNMIKRKTYLQSQNFNN